MSTSAPPAGSDSQQRLHSVGFLREGLKPASPTSRPPIPPNGLLQTLQRGAEGSKRNRWRMRTSGAWPRVSNASHSSDCASVCPAPLALGVVSGTIPLVAWCHGGRVRGKSHGTLLAMCRNIKQLHNFEPPATQEEVREASLQYVRKISGSTKPSQANAVAFERAVDEVAQATARLLDAL